MATTKPRITLSLDPHIHQVLRVISGASGQPMSGIIMELLETSMPVFERLAATMQRVKAMKDEQRATLLAALSDAEATLAPVAAGVLGQFDMFLGTAEALAAGAQPPQGGATGARAARTPPTNRGVTPQNRKPAKPSATKAPRVISASRISSKKRG